MKKYIKKHKGIAVLFMIAGVLNALIGVFSSYTMQYVTEIVANGKKDRIKEMFLMVIILAVGLALIYLFYMYAKNKFSMKVICDIRQDLFQSILNRKILRSSKECTKIFYTGIVLSGGESGTLQRSFIWPDISSPTSGAKRVIDPSEQP